MKKIILLLAFLLAFGHAASLFAQDQKKEDGETSSKYKESEFYYYNVTIEKIFAHRLGFVVVYRRGSSNHLATTYIPSNWFSDIGGKGEIVGLGTGSEWPSMIVYYKGGEFSHVRLRLRRDRTHVTWGMIPLTVNIDEFFKDVEDIKLVF